MRDYLVVAEGLAPVPISQLKTSDVHIVLRRLSEVQFEGGLSLEAVRERLVLELQIRELGLRHV